MLNDIIEKYLNEARHSWNWSDEEWEKYAKKCENLIGIAPKRKKRPSPDEQVFVILHPWSIGDNKEIKHIKDLTAYDYTRLDCYLPTIKEWNELNQQGGEGGK